LVALFVWFVFFKKIFIFLVAQLFNNLSSDPCNSLPKFDFKRFDFLSFPFNSFQFLFFKKINFNPPYLFILKNLNNSLRKEGKNNCLIMTQGKGISVCSFFASSQSHLQNSLSSIQQKFRYNSSTALLLGPPQSYYFFVFFFIIF